MPPGGSAFVLGGSTGGANGVTGISQMGLAGSNQTDTLSFLTGAADGIGAVSVDAQMLNTQTVVSCGRRFRTLLFPWTRKHFRSISDIDFDVAF